jgi:hypothetical protein
MKLRLTRHVVRNVPRDAATWLAGVARTCKAWHGPALRHLYGIIQISLSVDCGHQGLLRHTVPLGLLGRIGPRASTLSLDIRQIRHSGTGDFNISGYPFTSFMNLMTLIMFTPPPWYFPGRPLHDFIPIHSCPSLPNLVNLFMWTFDDNQKILLFLLSTCTNLRRLGFNIWPSKLKFEAYSRGGFKLPEPVLPKRLEELTINFAKESLESLFVPRLEADSKTRMDIERTEDYRLVNRIIKASSGSLRSISLRSVYDSVWHYSPVENGARRLEAQRLLEALNPCRSLRFLRLDGYPIYGSLSLRDLFELLAPLPIEFLSLNGPPLGTMHYHIDTLPSCLFLLPNLRVIMLNLHPKHINRLQAKARHVVVEQQGPGDNTWPPFYNTLSRKAQAVLKRRPYRMDISLRLSRLFSWH